MSSVDRPGAISAGSEETFPASRSKWIGILAICLVFTGVGVWLLLRTDEVMAWAVAGFFGIGSIMAVAAMLPGSTCLGLDAAGFTVCNLFRKTRISWLDVASFHVTRLGMSRFVAIRYQAHAAPTPGLRAALNRHAGAQAFLPDTYGMNVETLCALMNERLDRARSRVATPR